MLEYDNSAFYYFALSITSFYLVPSWYGIFKQIYTSTIGTDPSALGVEARTTVEKKKAENLRNASRGLKGLNDGKFISSLVITSLLSLVWVWMLYKVMEEGEIHSFDPFTILGIDSGADVKAIKKAYRSKSLQYHPDKNPGDKLAETMFMNVAKAYEALTDPTAKENYRLYGNPDGKQSMEVSIGLPTFLLDERNKFLILLIYLTLMVGVVPYWVWKYYSHSSKLGENNIMYDTYSWFYHALSKDITVRHIPEVLSGAAEFRKSNKVADGEMPQLTKILTKCKSSMMKPSFSHPTLLKGNLLLHAHLLGMTDQLNASQIASLKLMLKDSSNLLEAMIGICKNQGYLSAVKACIEFSQMLTQGCWTKASPFMQLPHFTDEFIKEKLSDMDLRTYLALNDAEKPMPDGLTDAQKKDVLAACSIMPQVKMETKIFVDDDEDDAVYEEDLITIQVTLTRKDKAKSVYAPNFPFPKKEGWWIIMGKKEEGRIIGVDIVKSSLQTVEHRIKMQAPNRAGTYDFDILLKSNAYVGFDMEDKVSVTVLDNSALPEYKIHPDDAELDDEPTLFEEIMQANVEQDSDSDDDDSDDDDSDDEDDGPAIRELTPAELKKEALKKQRAQQADDSDSDSDVEEVHAD
eukprot:CAMPEP_0196815454 /NCGR_PEP_ID=MMETSP1362-20130617/49873_1 /TAXON_ID=163516 /ORGANISM="Leptocylindrus danicus, Strain CCMP1856" /LENGTH=632 /DNA_ID=CAMNT_0042192409 /DNA_START=115 /DNA_END=2013 /DNA_ORIENTATION=-